MSSQRQDPCITKRTEISPHETKWVTLQKVEYTDETGQSRSWEVASRKTRGKSGVDAVAIGNVLLHPSKPPSTMLVIQYRPPVDAYTVEWPAGLIDQDETPEEAAVRELKEETGLEGTVTGVGPVVSSDPGMTSANLQVVMVEVQLTEGDELPEQRLEDGEAIERVIVPLDDLYDKLLHYSKQNRTIVAAKLFNFAAGMHFARTTKHLSGAAGR